MLNRMYTKCKEHVNILVLSAMEGYLLFFLSVLLLMSFQGVALAGNREIVEQVRLHAGDRSFWNKVGQDKVSRMVEQICRERSLSCSNVDVTFQGKPTNCNLIFQFRQVQLGSLLLEGMSGRVPIGNLYMLVENMLEWPASVVVKDVDLSLKCDHFSEFVSKDETIVQYTFIPRRAVITPANQLVRVPFKGQNEIIPRLYKLGLTFQMRGGQPSFRNIGEETLVGVTCTVPSYIASEEEVFLIGKMMAVPGGCLAYKAFLMVLKGNVLFSSPLINLAERHMSKVLLQAISKINDKSKTVFFPEKMSLEDDLVVLGGTGIVNLLSYTSQRKEEKWNNLRTPVEPSILLNRFY